MTFLQAVKEGAHRMDKQDPLAKYRNRFYLPKGKIYMDGNSLGLLSKEGEKSLFKVLEQWKRLGIEGWLDKGNPWFYYGEKLGAMQAPLVGAEEDEVIVTGTTTINLHALVGTFYQPQGSKTKILADELNFPSDIYALKSQIKNKGLDPQEQLRLVKSKDNRLIDEDDIISRLEEESEEIALILLPSVYYRSGQLLDMERLTAKAQEKNIPIGFDCSHSIGAVPHEFDQWEVDFALWCNYKHMNGGPGATASLYVNRKHFGKEISLAGWWGYRKDKQFDMLLEFEQAIGTGGWQISSPQILSTAPLEGSLKIFREAGIENIRKKSISLTSYLIYLLEEEGLAKAPYNYYLGSPRDITRRGGHVAIEHENAASITKALKERGIVPDFRAPNIIRLAPLALYNTFYETWQVIRNLKDIIDQKEHERHENIRDTIA
ncbi:MAG: kynureninase [Bacillota bacterium]